MLRDRQQRRGAAKKTNCFLSLVSRYLLLYLISNVKRRMKNEEVGDVPGTWYLVHCTWYLVQSLIKQIPTNPQIQERAIAGVVWSDEIAFLGHQTGIQVIVLEEHSSSVDPEVKE
jgi:hypothetical protein